MEMEEEVDLSKLTLQIFSKLEQKWLSEPNGGYNLHLWSPPTGPGHHRRKTRILAIDGGVGPDGLVAAHALTHLESLLQSHSGNPSARIAHHFDLVAGTGLGGVLAALITASSDPSSHHPMMSAAEASDLLLSSLPKLFKPRRRRWWGLRRRRSGSGSFSARSFEKVVKGVFKGMTLRDACRPLLVPCCDVGGGGAALVFSRADAAAEEGGRFDFELWAVCRATAATPGLFRPCRMRSVDGGEERGAVVDGGLVMNNPAAAAVTHVLHNKSDFPHVRGVEDLVVLSFGNGRPPPVAEGRRRRGRGSDGRDGGVMEIVLRGVSDTVDQMLANAFAWNRADYVRIQANGLGMAEEERKKEKKKEGRKVAAEGLRAAGERMLREKGLEALPFGGKRLLEATNAERMEAFVRRLVATRPEKPLLLLPAPTASPPMETNDTVTLDDGQ